MSSAHKRSTPLPTLWTGPGGYRDQRAVGTAAGPTAGNAPRKASMVVQRESAWPGGSPRPFHAGAPCPQNERSPPNCMSRPFSSSYDPGALAWVLVNVRIQGPSHASTALEVGRNLSQDQGDESSTSSTHPRNTAHPSVNLCRHIQPLCFRRSRGRWTLTSPMT